MLNHIPSLPELQPRLLPLHGEVEPDGERELQVVDVREVDHLEAGVHLHLGARELDLGVVGGDAEQREVVHGFEAGPGLKGELCCYFSLFTGRRVSLVHRSTKADPQLLF